MEQLYLWLWIFFLYAFLGWCSEVVFAAVKTGKFVNRGYLLGPVCPIYGMGVALVLWALAPLEGNLLVLYFGSVLITSALEFLLGWISEKLLHQRLWDYSNMPFNICGHVCLAFSLVWGFACLLVVRVFHPVLMGLVALIPHLVGWILLAVFSAAFLTDLILTTAAALKLPRQIRAVEDMEKLLRSISDNIGESLYSGVTKLELEGGVPGQAGGPQRQERGAAPGAGGKDRRLPGVRRQEPHVSPAGEGLPPSAGGAASPPPGGAAGLYGPA